MLLTQQIDLDQISFLSNFVLFMYVNPQIISERSRCLP